MGLQGVKPVISLLLVLKGTRFNLNNWNYPREEL